MITRNLPVTTKFLTQYCNNEDLSFVFTKKIVLEKEIKLKEFNFKLLHGILPCNKNLKQWKIKLSDKCDVCERQQTIEHLLFECSYVKPLWRAVENVLDLNLSFRKILGIVDCDKQDKVLTMISFLIYKEWLLMSLDNKNRNSVIDLGFYKNELTLRFKIYELCSSYDPTDIAYMNVLICNLC